MMQHSFDVEIAKEYEILESIMLVHLDANKNCGI